MRVPILSITLAAVGGALAAVGGALAAVGGAAPCEEEIRAIRNTPAKPGVRAVLAACATRFNSPTARLALAGHGVRRTRLAGMSSLMRALLRPPW